MGPRTNIDPASLSMGCCVIYEAANEAYPWSEACLRCPVQRAEQVVMVAQGIDILLSDVLILAVCASMIWNISPRNALEFFVGMYRTQISQTDSESLQEDSEGLVVRLDG